MMFVLVIPPLDGDPDTAGELANGRVAHGGSSIATVEYDSIRPSRAASAAGSELANSKRPRCRGISAASAPRLTAMVRSELSPIRQDAVTAAEPTARAS